MANIYVSNTGSNTAPYNSWATAATTMATAAGAEAAGDTIFVASTHTETTAASVSYSFSATVPNNILSTDTASSPPTTMTPGAIINTTGASNITITGSQYIEGLTFNGGSAANQSRIVLAPTIGGSRIYEFRNTTFILNNTAVGSYVEIGGYNDHKLTNCTFKFGNISQHIRIGPVKVTFDNLIIDAASTIPTSGLLKPGGTGLSVVTIQNSDLSAMGSNPIVLHANPSQIKLSLVNCKIASTAVLSSTPTYTSRVEGYNIDSAGTNYALMIYDMFGSILSETTLVKTSGANDGVTSLSWRMTSVTGLNFPSQVLRTVKISKWNDTVGTAITASIDILHDSLTALNNDDIWLEVQYFSSSLTPIGTTVTNIKSNWLATGSAHSSSAATWTTTGMTNPNKQKLSVTFTPQMKGFVTATICMAISSKTVYVDPLLTLA